MEFCIEYVSRNWKLTLRNGDGQKCVCVGGAEGFHRREESQQDLFNLLEMGVEN